VQAQCPQCAQRIVIDDAKVPDKPFAVKCPKCQAVVRLPGRAAAPAAPPPPEPDFFDEPVAAPPPPMAESTLPPMPTPTSEAAAPALNEEMRAQMMAQLRRELSGPPGDASSHERALVSIPDRGQSAAITLTLTRLGYSVDSVENPDEAGRLIEQGSYALAATSRAVTAAGRGESLYQRITRLSPEQRRGLFVILVGDDFKTGDGAQGFAVMADLVVNPREAAGADALIRTMLTERRRLYQAYLDARRRFEASTT
jgi:predicted Zn finger-like uncharacterized protein